eukprot:4607199-Prymnesium_polylepis.1
MAEQRVAGTAKVLGNDHAKLSFQFGCQQACGCDEQLDYEPRLSACEAGVQTVSDRHSRVGAQAR